MLLMYDLISMQPVKHTAAKSRHPYVTAMTMHAILDYIKYQMHC